MKNHENGFKMDQVYSIYAGKQKSIFIFQLLGVCHCWWTKAQGARFLVNFLFLNCEKKNIYPQEDEMYLVSKSSRHSAVSGKAPQIGLRSSSETADCLDDFETKMY